MLTSPLQAAPGAETTWSGGGGEEPPGDFSSFYQSEESFSSPTPPALYGSAYLKGPAAPPPGPALTSPAPTKAEGPAPGECPAPRRDL